MDKKQGLQNTFDTVAKGYDHPALSFFPETAKRMVQYLAPNTSTSSLILDVCTGTGVVALEAATQCSDTKITGIDLSAGMLAEAQSKADAQQLENITFTQMDLEHLDFPDQHFDIATCSFGIFFLDDMEHALKSILSKLKPSGKIALSTFTKNAFEPMSIHFLALYESFGYEIPPLSWKQITSDDQLTALFTTAGMTEIEIHREPLGFHLKDANDWWDVVWNAGYRGLLNKLTEDELSRFKEQHLAEIQALCDKGETWLDTGVVIVIGQFSQELSDS